MPRSRTRAKPSRPRPRRWNWRRVFGGLSELARNLALVAVSAPFLEPLLTDRAGIDAARAALGAGIGLAFLAASLILDHERSDR